MSGIIKAIDGQSVHRICSGQVILSLAVAVKELLENSLDAGATIVDIRLRESGSELIEVIDNGSGVEEHNYEGLTLKHHTSKLADFSDLSTVGTFGFRGEALSSLCALAQVTVSTRTEQESVGTRLEFDLTGKLVSRTPCARERGTTVQVENLFHTLPVRLREFQRNLKKEFGKLIHLLQAYCIGVNGVKITCTNQSGAKSSGRSIVLHSNGAREMRDRITCVYGSKCSQQLHAFQFSATFEDVARRKRARRPVHLNEILEAVDEPPCQSQLLNVEVEEVVEAEDLADSTGPRQMQAHGFISLPISGCGRNANDRQYFFINGRPCELPKVAKVVNEIYHQFNAQQLPMIFIDITLSRETVDINVTPDKRTIMLHDEDKLLVSIRERLTALFEPYRGTFSATFDRPLTTMSGFSILSQRSQSSLSSSTASEAVGQGESQSIEDSQVVDNDPEIILPAPIDVPSQQEDNDITMRLPPPSSKRKRGREEKRSSDVDMMVDRLGVAVSAQVAADDEMKGRPEKVVVVETELEDELYDSNALQTHADVSVSFDLALLQDCMLLSSSAIAEQEQRSREKARFHAKIAKSDDREAELELSKQITKEDFAKMAVLGQFNLGFIIAHLNDDLFIVDQHASDEKYNFETLQQSTKLETQKLMTPIPLQLTAANEAVVMDNRAIIEKNGFTLDIDATRPPTQRVKVTTLPISKGTTFGIADLEELVFMLSDAPQVMCRPSRVRSMFAMRACRSSVMIGTALKQKEMLRVLRHMGEIEQPWNCPHGRPTMRHLCDLSLIDFGE